MSGSVILALLVIASVSGGGGTRRPGSEQELRYWLENMVAYHRFSVDEVRAATGLHAAEIEAALMRFDIAPGVWKQRPDEGLVMLPYPGGRHPRIGFLDGAVEPQRETKFSVFTPWDPSSYVVVDLPEAIWSNLGLTYLAHTHVPTIWTKSKIELEPLEWVRQGNDRLESRRLLPNGISFGAVARSSREAVHMELWLHNGTRERLTDLRVQNCVLLKGAKGFDQQTNENKFFENPYVACRSPDGRRWIITGWEGCHRAWGNPPCPCLHADPKFLDCEPGQTQRLRGWLSFYEGTDLRGELKRIEATGWRSNTANR